MLKLKRQRSQMSCHSLVELNYAARYHSAELSFGVSVRSDM